jgi:uncharacterized protein YecA (UPF0149 family)
MQSEKDKPRIKVVTAPWVKNKVFGAQYGTINNAGKHYIQRNDPCPCKSGKKYKKCCKANYERRR